MEYYSDDFLKIDIIEKFEEHISRQVKFCFRNDLILENLYLVELWHGCGMTDSHPASQPVLTAFHVAGWCPPTPFTPCLPFHPPACG